MFREVRDKGNVIIVIGFMGSELWMVRSFFIIRMKGGYVVIILNDGDILRELFIYCIIIKEIGDFFLFEYIFRSWIFRCFFVFLSKGKELDRGYRVGWGGCEVVCVFIGMAKMYEFFLC